MTYMMANYLQIDLPSNVTERFPPYYKLVRYVEGLPPRGTYREMLDGFPILFIPGNAGSANQVRSLGAESSRMEGVPLVRDDHLGALPDHLAPQQERRWANKLNFYAVDFDEELSALSGSVLERQSAFSAQAAAFLLALYGPPQPTNGPAPEQVRRGGPATAAIPDSISFFVCPFPMRRMGGVVAHSLAIHQPAVIPLGAIHTIVALAAPLAAPPNLHVPSVHRFYEASAARWAQLRGSQPPVPLISVGAGVNDVLVRTDLTALADGWGPLQVALGTSALRGAGMTVDHQCLLWCNQAVRTLCRALHALAAAPPLETRSQLEAFAALVESPFPSSFLASQLVPASAAPPPMASEPPAPPPHTDGEAPDRSVALPEDPAQCRSLRLAGWGARRSGVLVVSVRRPGAAAADWGALDEEAFCDSIRSGLRLRVPGGPAAPEGDPWPLVWAAIPGPGHVTGFMQRDGPVPAPPPYGSESPVWAQAPHWAPICMARVAMPDTAERLATFWVPSGLPRGVQARVTALPPSPTDTTDTTDPTDPTWAGAHPYGLARAVLGPLAAPLRLTRGHAPIIELRLPSPRAAAPDGHGAAGATTGTRQPAGAAWWRGLWGASGADRLPPLAGTAGPLGDLAMHRLVLRRIWPPGAQAGGPQAGGTFDPVLFQASAGRPTEHHWTHFAQPAPDDAEAAALIGAPMPAPLRTGTGANPSAARGRLHALFPALRSLEGSRAPPLEGNLTRAGWKAVPCEPPPHERLATYAMLAARPRPRPGPRWSPAAQGWCLAEPLQGQGAYDRAPRFQPAADPTVEGQGGVGLHPGPAGGRSLFLLVDPAAEYEAVLSLDLWASLSVAARRLVTAVPTATLGAALGAFALTVIEALRQPARQPPSRRGAALLGALASFGRLCRWGLGAAAVGLLLGVALHDPTPLAARPDDPAAASSASASFLERVTSIPSGPLRWAAAWLLWRGLLLAAGAAVGWALALAVALLGLAPLRLALFGWWVPPLSRPAAVGLLAGLGGLAHPRVPLLLSALAALRTAPQGHGHAIQRAPAKEGSRRALLGRAWLPVPLVVGLLVAAAAFGAPELAADGRSAWLALQAARRTGRPLASLLQLRPLRSPLAPLGGLLWATAWSLAAAGWARCHERLREGNPPLRLTPRGLEAAASQLWASRRRPPGVASSRPPTVEGGPPRGGGWFGAGAA
ncbi:putative Hydrolase; acting on ester bonds [Paratrimastix pyriformis]|uniref:Hydrolase n=1 Tax=Paratrimastix pyriformis TaxID=342808 RepID=A0ABQ8UVR1_9EUKA|nr:putative Hydrolase; acting on ester bonds [Paratrimastix pyriformis]